MNIFEEAELRGQPDFRPKLAVGYPWMSPFMFTACVESLLNLEHPARFQVRYMKGHGWSPSRRHIHICEQALEWGADYILILGSDQVYEEDLLVRLTTRLLEGYEVIAALVPSRGHVPWQPMAPFQPMAWRWKTPEEMGTSLARAQGRRFRSMTLDGDMVHVIRRDDGDVQPIDFIGSGVLCFHRDHLLALKRPWFYETIDVPSQIRIANMDTRFVARLRQEAHARIWVDTTIQVRHLHVFQIDDSYQERFADWALGEGKPDPQIVDQTRPERLDTYVSTGAVHGTYP